MRALLLGCAFLLKAPQALAKPHRDPGRRAAFVKLHPCPPTGGTRGRRPGYVVDHIQPLCAGGPDAASNMQWQTREEARVKDREERRLCAGQTREKRAQRP